MQDASNQISPFIPTKKSKSSFKIWQDNHARFPDQNTIQNIEGWRNLRNAGQTTPKVGEVLQVSKIPFIT
jgi:hypothetical protein